MAGNGLPASTFAAHGGLIHEGSGAGPWHQLNAWLAVQVKLLLHLGFVNDVWLPHGCNVSLHDPRSTKFAQLLQPAGGLEFL
jgi:hypothetical protein